MALSIAELNEKRSAKQKKKKQIKNKITDTLIHTRHDTDTRFNNRIKKLTIQCGADGHGKYQSDWYVGEEDINERKTDHTCDYPEECSHTDPNYKASDNDELIHCGDIELKYLIGKEIWWNQNQLV